MPTCLRAYIRETYSVKMWFHRTNIIWILISFSCMTSCHSTNQTVTAGAGSSSPVDKLADIVTKMQSLARLVNGISLEIGFIDGSIPSDDAIAELLYTDPSKLQEMMSVNSSVANRITNGFDTIYSDISSAPDNVKIMEKRLAVLEDISLILDTVSLEKVDSKDYGTKLRDVGEFVNKFTQIHEKYWTEMKKYLDDMHRIFTHLVTDSPTDSEIEQTVESFPDYVKTFENVQKAVPYFEQVVTVLRRAKEIDNMFLVFRPLIFESQLRSQLASTGKYDQESIDLLGKLFEDVLEFSQDSKSFLENLESIENLIWSKATTTNLPVQLMIGFTEGSKDIELLQESSGSILNSSRVSSSLETAFKSFGSFGKDISNFESSWKSTLKRANQSSLDEMKNMLKIMSSLSYFKSVSAHLEAITKCDASGSSSTESLTELPVIYANMKFLDQGLKMQSSFDYINQFKDLSLLITRFTIGPEKDKIQEARSVIAWFNVQNANRIQNARKFVSDFEKLQTSMTKLGDLLKIVGESFSKIEGYQKMITDPKHLSFYQCLTAAKDKEGGVRALLENFAVFRAIPSSTIANTKLVVDGITDSQHKLQALRSMALKMKSVDGREALALKTSFPDSQKIAFDLGLAVLGVSTIKKVIDNRSELAPLTKELKDIEEAAGNSTEDISTLQDLKSSVISMFKGIDDFLSSDFSSDGKIFEEAAKIPGIAGFNYKSLKAAVEAVDTTGKFSGIVNALEVITNLDLDFEKYDIKSASSSLKALDAFFNKYEATLFPPTTTIPPATPLSSPAPSNQSPPSQPQPGPRGSSPPAPSAPSAPETDTNSLALVDLTDSPADPTPEVSGFMWFILISYILFFVMGTAGTVFFVKRFLKTGQNVKPKTPKKKINGNSSAKDDVTSHHNSDPLRSARS
ncbi:uncharacterized protein CELE_F14F7.5 [Caenorhabditis elegans]|uniref:Domain of unknown function WSN domain-containing protein n=1 Tax=Caenorhabditis elegans TaxID=6239 RepID=X5LQ00_CAEEL|nr:protein of unknown function WSN domain-containing protein [Caenorhabditis elegans]CDO41121.1 Domain of unknown function WSN domain-containing protein [Caenorhabditis elegans]|eukprot:NP_001293624.1 Uncharacterized protein CELE_F14F7.5 [Caenorhabditis elegans]